MDEVHPGCECPSGERFRPAASPVSGADPSIRYLRSRSAPAFLPVRTVPAPVLVPGKNQKQRPHNLKTGTGTSNAAQNETHPSGKADASGRVRLLYFAGPGTSISVPDTGAGLFRQSGPDLRSGFFFSPAVFSFLRLNNYSPNFVR